MMDSIEQELCRLLSCKRAEQKEHVQNIIHKGMVYADVTDRPSRGCASTCCMEKKVLCYLFSGFDMLT